jgi:hypothetical protein
LLEDIMLEKAENGVGWVESMVRKVDTTGWGVSFSAVFPFSSVVLFF